MERLQEREFVEEEVQIDEDEKREESEKVACEEHEQGAEAEPKQGSVYGINLTQETPSSTQGEFIRKPSKLLFHKSS